MQYSTRFPIITIMFNQDRGKMLSNKQRTKLLLSPGAANTMNCIVLNKYEFPSKKSFLSKFS